MKSPVTVSEAIEIIRQNTVLLGNVTVALDHALGRVLSEDICAGENIPPFDNAGMDGFAVRHEDLQTVPKTLHLIGEIPAGINPADRLGSGEAMAIMTGAKIPAGCTAVVRQEDTKSVGASEVSIQRVVREGENIRRAGNDIKSGSLVLRSRTRLRPQDLGILASLGIPFVQVFRVPRVALLATGRELVPVAGMPPAGKIRNSNTTILTALLKESGSEVIDLGIAGDNEAELRAAILNGLSADVLITIGGVSVGKYDLVKKVLEETRVQLQFTKINVKPGMPTVFGMCGRTAVFGLPGNPVSSLVAFLKFVRPAIWNMTGLAGEQYQPVLRARIAHTITKPDQKRHFSRGVLESRNGTLWVRQTGAQTSNMLTSLSNANCLMSIPEDVTELAVGSEVEVELLT